MEQAAGISCILQKALDWGVDIRIMVIGGQAVLGYCGRTRLTKDTDAVSPNEDTGVLIELLTNCGFNVEQSTFGLRAKRRRDGDQEVLHISLGDIADESRGEGNVVRYPVSESSYEEAVELPLLGLVIDDGLPAPVAPVLPLEDLLLTKILPVGRTTDMEDVVLLVVTRQEEMSLDKLAERIHAAEELRRPILERLEHLAEFVRAHPIGTAWLGRAWTPTDKDKVLRFLRRLSSRID